LGTALEMPVWLICGFIVPLLMLPDWVRPISWLLPPTWGVSALKGAAFGGTPWFDILMCLLVAALYGVAGTLLSGRMVQSARTHATLALT
jgi:ABC-2 type transport system permease protein